MGYEKQKAVERNDKRRQLASSLRENRKVELDFGVRPDDDPARAEVSRVFLDLLSAIADGEVGYITVGKSRDGGAVLLTITDGHGVKSYAGGHNWDKFARECYLLFDPDA